MTWTFPLIHKQIRQTNNSESFKDINLKSQTEIPVENHPGAFGYIRKHHTHEGVDLYCLEEDPVIAVEDGQVLNIVPFTGKIADSDWWHDTWAVMVHGTSGTVCYGEITPSTFIQKNAYIKAGQLIGSIKQVLKKDKGRPMNMLHLELYKGRVEKPVCLDHFNGKPLKPEQFGLLDPTPYLIEAALNPKV